MTQYDPLVQTAASQRWPTGWLAPGAPATIVIHANLINSVARKAQLAPGRRPSAGCVTPHTQLRGERPTTPKPKTA